MRMTCPLLTVLIFLTACKSQSGASRTFEQRAIGENSEVSTAIAALSGTFDDISGAGFIPGETCGSRVGSLDCILNQRMGNYSGCQVTDGKLYGNITLNYSRSDCGFPTYSDFVSRSFSSGHIEYVVEPFTNQVRTQLVSDYEGNSHNGGSTVRPESGSTWRVQVDGYGRKVTNSGTVLLDQVVFSPSGILVSTLQTGSIGSAFARGSRTASSGSLIVMDNQRRFKAVLNLSNLNWSTTNCCYPSSGTVSVSYSGSINENRVLIFTGCGQYRFTRTTASETTTGAGTLTHCDL